MAREPRINALVELASPTVTEFVRALEEMCPGEAFMFADESIPVRVTLQLVQGMSGKEFVAVGLGEPSDSKSPMRMT